MRAIQLITIVGIAVVSKGAESASLRQQQNDEDNPNIFGKSRKRNTSNESTTAQTPLPHPFNMTTCTPTQTPCHDENRDVLSCADPGETCPCYFNELQCHSDTYGDYCDTTCCEWGIEERCHGRDKDDPTVWDVWCAKIDEGGCPCPEGEQKCNTDNSKVVFKDEFDFRNQRRSPSPHHIEGHCAKVCCRDDEATCYDENYEPHSCVLIENGGCSCPEGQVRCHGTKDWEGTCEEICCETEGEIDCYDNAGTKFCSKGGQCPNGTMGYGYWESRLVSTIIQKGTRSQVSYYSKIVTRKKDAETTSSVDVIKHLEAEELALFHTISSNERNTAVDVKKKEEIIVSIS